MATLIDVEESGVLSSLKQCSISHHHGVLRIMKSFEVHLKISWKKAHGNP